jgi:multicomponent Na+:H+ antiporter subunit F
MITLAYILLGISLVLVTGRLLVGPSLSDRVVALDMLSFIAVGVIAVYTIATGSAVMLDAALVLALVAFLGTVAFARFVERNPSVLRSTETVESKATPASASPERVPAASSEG